ncbi:hypothetical protein B0T24DRAFT_163545 [Lasiosphaeria ovina]|uniref:Uncharacterized protein n=1 Tax=Lasiosphaeria ovina TaxID=92902 RepID=A0AAE0NDN8_9PEZI|nr:hypothetical protein B0T24DRAFT_163545 [Lasiosphaeria ovina]
MGALLMYLGGAFLLHSRVLGALLILGSFKLVVAPPAIWITSRTTLFGDFRSRKSQQSRLYLLGNEILPSCVSRGRFPSLEPATSLLTCLLLQQIPACSGKICFSFMRERSEQSEAETLQPAQLGSWSHRQISWEKSEKKRKVFFF